MINHAWFGLSVDWFISLTFKGWVMLARKCSSGKPPPPTDVQGLGVPVTQPSDVMVVLKRKQEDILKRKREGQGLSGHPLHLALELGTGFLFTGDL